MGVLCTCFACIVCLFVFFLFIFLFLFLHGLKSREAVNSLCGILSSFLLGEVKLVVIVVVV